MRSSVLVVDDDAPVREALADALEDEGYSVMLASNGEEALAKISSARPDLILLDVMMPSMDGWHFLSARLRDPDVIEVPVLLMSAHPSAVRAAQRIGMVTAVAKPFQLDELLALIVRSLAPGPLPS
jgi:two-component system response regulator MprA